MITFLLILANISILVIAYAIPKVALVSCAKKYDMTTEDLLYERFGLATTIDDYSIGIIALAHAELIMPVFIPVLGVTINFMLFIAMSCIIVWIVSIGLPYLISIFDDIKYIDNKLCKQSTKL